MGQCTIRCPTDTAPGPFCRLADPTAYSVVRQAHSRPGIPGWDIWAGGPEGAQRTLRGSPWPGPRPRGAARGARPGAGPWGRSSLTEVVRSQSGFGGSLREPAGDGHCGDRSGASQRCGATSSTQIFIYSILRHGVPRTIMSEDTKSSDYRYPRFGDQQDWRKWTQKAKPKLYAIQSKAEPEKTVYQLLQGPNPHETGRH